MTSWIVVIYLDSFLDASPHAYKIILPIINTHSIQGDHCNHILSAVHR